jgi:hypothetical protein
VNQAWSPEMEMIDQLTGGDTPLRVFCRIFDDDASLRRTLVCYVSKDVVILKDQDGEFTKWKSLDLLRTPVPLDTLEQVRVELTDSGGKAFEDGTWDKL